MTFSQRRNSQKDCDRVQIVASGDLRRWSLQRGCMKKFFGGDETVLYSDCGYGSPNLDMY